MRKTTFYGLAAFGGVCAVFCCHEVLMHGSSSPVPPEVRVEQDFSQIHFLIKMYAINAGRPPATSQGLEALVHEPTTGPKPKRWSQAMKKQRMDPWGRLYQYTLLKPKEREWRWELRSAGQDGVFGSGDDMTAEEESGGSVSPELGEKVAPRPSF